MNETESHRISLKRKILRGKLIDSGYKRTNFTTDSGNGAYDETWESELVIVKISWKPKIKPAKYKIQYRDRNWKRGIWAHYHAGLNLSFKEANDAINVARRDYARTHEYRMVPVK